MIVILLGAPGSGKGTQSAGLVAKFGFKHLATGDILRGEVAQGTELGKKAEGYMKAGKLVPDAVIIEMVAGKVEPGKNYLFDGFPRTLDQAQGLDQILKRSGSSVDLVVYLTLPVAEAIKRMASRRVCKSCATVYNVLSNPTKAEGVCDKCGGQVVQRDDDTEATAQKRLMVFDDQTHPLVAYYKGEQILKEVDANRAPDAVAAALSAAIDSAKAVR
ncbi:MAG TPA: adenylate kinase [Elusimicrobiota bacterium]|nr:adenylate kinase [Elusimicrobiota bacterium]